MPITRSGTASILVIEDGRDALEALQYHLREEGYEVHAATDGLSGLAMALDLAPDLVVLDVGLPGRDGLHVARELRDRGFEAPVLMLTAYDTVDDRVQGLNAGADDYLVKPFAVAELLARIKALIRRAERHAAAPELRVGDLVVDPIAREVTRGGRAIPLTQKEYALLEYLVRHAGHPVSRERIAEHVWKQTQGTGAHTNVVDVYINYLRRKIDAGCDVPLIHTVRGVGYVVREG